MKMTLKAALLMATALALPMSANAALLGRDINGNAVAGSAASSVFLYDTVLEVTWLRNANVSGATTWDNAKTWAANLTVGVYSEWRLPTMIDTDASGCANSGAFGGTDCGFNVQTTSDGAVYSEMASLFFATLGNKARYDTSGTLQAAYGLTNTGDFQNLQSDAYWSGLEYAPDSRLAWAFSTHDGYQDGAYFKFYNQYALAVLDGDVLVAPIPEPETYALMLAGLAVVGAAAKRKARRAN